MIHATWTVVYLIFLIFQRDVSQVMKSRSPIFCSDLSLTACVRDIFVAAADTTNSSLEHGILHVCLQPAIQRKVQEEIDHVIGRTREPCYEDRKRMPYTQAVLNEILRYSTPIAIISRCPVRDQVFQGQYEIAKVLWQLKGSAPGLQINLDPVIEI